MRFIDGSDDTLKPIAEAIFGRFKKYEILIWSDIAQCPVVLDAGFGTHYFQDANVLRRHVSIEEPSEGESSDRTIGCVCSASSGSSLQMFVDENSVHEQFKDEVIIVLNNTSIGIRKCKRLE